MPMHSSVVAGSAWQCIIGVEDANSKGLHFLTTLDIELNSRAILGADSALGVPVKLCALGLRRVGLVIDKTVAGQAAAQALLEHWKAAGLELTHYFEARTGLEPDYDYLDVVAAEFRPLELDVIVGIGGGSTLDLVKGVAILMRNPGPGIAYRGMNLVPAPGLPLVVIPTVAGSGSEVSSTASFIDPKTQTKLGINGRNVAALFAVLDPVLLTACPASVTMGSALDAMVHATEACTATTANRISVLLGAEAMRLIFNALPAVIADNTDRAALGDLLLASTLAGLAMAHAAGGPASGISYPLGVHCGVPHGFAGGLLLPHIVAVNVGKGYAAGYAELYDRMQLGGDGDTLTTLGKANYFKARLLALHRQIGAPKDLLRWQVGSDSIALLTNLTLAQRQGNLDLNPVPFERKAVTHVLAAAMGITGDEYAGI